MIRADNAVFWCRTVTISWRVLCPASMNQHNQNPSDLSISRLRTPPSSTGCMSHQLPWSCRYWWSVTHQNRGPKNVLQERLVAKIHARRSAANICRRIPTHTLDQAARQLPSCDVRDLEAALAQLVLQYCSLSCSLPLPSWWDWQKVCYVLCTNHFLISPLMAEILNKVSETAWKT